MPPEPAERLNISDIGALGGAGRAQAPRRWRGRSRRRRSRCTGTAASLALAGTGWHADGMESNTNSSITLPAEEFRLVRSLEAKLKVRRLGDLKSVGDELRFVIVDRAPLVRVEATWTLVRPG